MKRVFIGIFAIGALSALGLLGAASRSSAQTLPGVGEPGAAAASAPATTVKSNDVADAWDKFKQRDFDGALKLLQKAVKKNSDFPPAHVIMADFFSRTNRPMGVRNALERAVMNTPDDPEAYVHMGDLAVRERRVAEAQMLFEKAQSLMAKFNTSKKRKEFLQLRIFGGMAAVNETRDRWADAQQYLIAALELDPKSSVLMQRLARSMFQQKKPDGALDMLRQAAAVDSEVLTPEVILAQMYDQAGDKENAKQWLTAALKAAPTDIRTRLFAGQWNLERGDIEGAKDQAAAALRIDPKSIDAEILRGVISLFQKDYTAAERYFEAAHTQEPNNFAATNNLALALVEQEEAAKKQRALEYAQKNVQRYSQVAEAYSTYGWVLYNLGKLDQAERAFQAASSSGQIKPDTAYYYARLCRDQGREAMAKQLLDGALKSTGPFAMRHEAGVLMEQFKK